MRLFGKLRTKIKNRYMKNIKNKIITSKTHKGSENCVS